MDDDTKTPPIHPGAYIKDYVIPSDLSVKAAAELIGVGRPALSNLLNGNAALSPGMALRMEKTFGASHEDLLRRQAAFDAHQARATGRGIAVRAYVPSFLTITARDIEHWVDRNLQARSRLAVFLRKLVHSTGLQLSHVDLPGHDNAERPGWDGQVEAGTATPWVPVGKSGWEFGCDKEPKKKAEGDYAKTVKAVAITERADMTFVFVTPRAWPGKNAWVKRKEALGEWKTVRAYDASDLEQWLEQSIPAQGWMAEQIGLPSAADVSSLDEQWQRWASPTDPELPKDLFAPAIRDHTKTLKDWLEAPPSSPLVICADSKLEALAFLSCTLDTPDLATAGYRDRALVFASAKHIRTLLSPASPFIPIVFTDDAERELGGVCQRLHTIIIRPRNTVNATPNIALDRLQHEAFRHALAGIGIAPLEADKLARESGRSPTLLRRRLSRNPAIRTPLWAQDPSTVRHLIPMVLVGAWHVQSRADCEVLSLLASKPYGEVEKHIALLLSFDDPAVWSVGQFRGVASKIDALYAVGAGITQKDIDDFLVAAEIVLSEVDPALDLPEDKRWAAALYGKEREYSRALRDGLCETVVLLAVHGNDLFRNRLGVDVEVKINHVVRSLLTPLTLDRLLSHQDDLPLYAEAAPDEFLKMLEEELDSPNAQLYGLLKPADTGVLGSGCYRTGLLWALEGLAWRPERLLRVSLILAKLAQHPITDNWANRPDNSLRSIFRSWMPQTTASLEQRKRALDSLGKRFPELAWQVCIDQFTPESRVGHYNHRPRWRTDASGAGEPVTRREDYEFCRYAADLALERPKHDEGTLGDLVERLPGLLEPDRQKVWDLIDRWLVSDPADVLRATLRERIRRFALARRGRMRGLTTETRDRAREVYAALAPRNPAIRHQWLFKAHWVDESSNEIGDESLDYEAREQRVRKERLSALREIWVAEGVDGVLSLVPASEAPGLIGACMAEVLPDQRGAVAFLDHCLTIGDASLIFGCENLVHGFFSTVSADRRAELADALAAMWPLVDVARLLKCLPFEANTWQRVDAQPEDVRAQYWSDVHPGWLLKDFPDLNEAVDRLLEVRRPRAALQAVQGALEVVETSRLKRLLGGLGIDGADVPGTYQIDPYYLSKALGVLQARPGVTELEMAQLEFRFLRALDHSEYGIPNLERQLGSSPALFMQALGLAFKRSDNAEDPPELGIEGVSHSEAACYAAYALLDQVRRVPGAGDDRVIDADKLRAWVIEVRLLCAKYARLKIGDERIGQLLAIEQSPGDDGVWPQRPIRDVLEEIGSPEIATGVLIGVYNSRGAHYRREGGDDERNLAAQYRNWSSQLAVEYPYVSNLVAQIADEYDRDARREDTEAAVRSRTQR